MNLAPNHKSLRLSRYTAFRYPTGISQIKIRITVLMHILKYNFNFRLN
jgi:hypothetical protein